jgi:F-type H+-transporting ATPase subunit epsilon
MSDTFQLEIVTPTKLLVKEAAEEAQLPGLSGYLGILPGHAPLITELGVGAITYKASGSTHTLSVAWGFAEVLPDKVTILAEAAEQSAGNRRSRARKSQRPGRRALEEQRSPGGLLPRDSLAARGNAFECCQGKVAFLPASHPL